ncbi:hypothetical protein [Azospirillum rugosum]|uniref:Transcriptional regulator, AlpA family n=1 Tax=Azospirillum rugosum TaxID=416170 RepID=A0ABS4SFP4_9PROT|nr:hypothetical protein [Azospirillum rugosum]MBP2290767.1 hypothetical protein [Azospirillum rugosum]MDQ0525656.1 hypothetical protein [Azospirillum rugosum]
MARPKPKFTFTPRLMTALDVATYLNRSEQWFAMKRPQMEEAGFPRPDPLLGLYDQRAIDLWLDRRSGLATASPANDSAPRAANDAQAPDPFMAACGK